MQQKVTNTTHTVSRSQWPNEYLFPLFPCDEGEDSSSLRVVMGSDIVSAVDALNVLKTKLYNSFARAGLFNPEDLVGDTLLKLSELHQSGEALNARIVANIAREVYRHWFRERNLRAEVQIDFLPEVVLLPLSVDSQERPPSFLEKLLSVAIESLAETDREIVRCHILNKVSFEELAQLSTLSTNGIKVRHYRAIDKLRLTFLRELLSRYHDAA